MTRNRDPRVAVLSTLEVLSGATPRQLEQICGLVTEIRLRAGSVLCREGGYAREAFLLLDGHVGVACGDRPLAVVGAGSILGEMALIHNARRSATVTALDDVLVLVLNPAEFREVLRVAPVVADNLQALIAARTDELAAVGA